MAGNLSPMPWCDRCKSYHHDTADHFPVLGLRAEFARDFPPPDRPPNLADLEKQIRELAGHNAVVHRLAQLRGVMEPDIWPLFAIVMLGKALDQMTAAAEAAYLGETR